MLFRNPADKERLVQVFRAYVEEWGAENITLMLPRNWDSFVTEPNLGRVRVEFSTLDGISIRVTYRNVRHTCSFPFDPVR